MASGILDLLTGGEDTAAQNDLQQAQADYQNLQAPTTAQLTLPQLQAYVDAGLLTPAEATAAQTGPNAYNNINLNPADVEAQQTALSQLQDVAGSGGETAQMRAQMTAAMDQAATQEHGANASIMDTMAQRGIPTSLMGYAAEMANSGNEAQATNLAAAEAEGSAQQNALAAMSASGALGGQMQSQQFTQAKAAADAQNAINAQNAANAQQVALANQNANMTANTYNTQEAQDIANKNTQTGQYQTEYNATVPQTAYEDALQKAAGEAGVSGSQANLAQEQGQQEAGLIGAGIGAGATLGGGYLQGQALGTALQALQTPAAVQAPAPVTAGVNGAVAPYADGGYVNYESGALVPGVAEVPGDSYRNDKVKALVSPGEGIVPRTAMSNPNLAAEFAKHLAMKNHPKAPPIHPDDVRSLLDALTRRRYAPMAA